MSELTGSELYPREFDPEAEHLRPLDWVDANRLPQVEYFEPTRDNSLVINLLDEQTQGVPRVQIKSEELKELKPNPKIITMHDVGLDFEVLAATARTLAEDKFRHIIRMGGAFETERNSATPRELEAYAVEIMGPDATLSLHGPEQARRMDELMRLQQEVLQKLFTETMIEFGPTRKALEVYKKVCETLPNFTGQDVKKGVLCGLIHDYGEAKLGIDVPLERKLDPAYVLYEAGACVDFANEIHCYFPPSAAVTELTEEISVALVRRVSTETSDVEFHDPDHDLIAGILSPVEVTNAIYGTEQLHHGQVKRGEAFAAVEKLEYVLSGIRAFEAIEHNFQRVTENQVVTRELLRLGVSTFFRSLRQLTEYGEKYVYIYDFLRQNSGVISRYLDVVKQDILVRSGHAEFSDWPDIFGVDPFEKYPKNASESEAISRREAKDRFLETAHAWNLWTKKDHLAKRTWEANVGTTHEITAENPDVSFMQQTARDIHYADGNSKVAVSKHLQDMWGVGLDLESQEAHMALAA